MLKAIFLSVGILSLAACGAPGESGNTVGGGGNTGVGANPLPDSLARNLSNAVYNPTANTLHLTLYGFDSPQLDADFVRTPARDITSSDGTTTYRAYTMQENSLAREYVALFASSSFSTVGAVATEPEFGSVFGGVYHIREGAYVKPNIGSAEFVGGYAGIVTSLGADGHPARTTGDIYIRVNFNEGDEGHIEAGVSNRKLTSAIPELPTLDLPSIDLVDAALTDGNFLGIVKLGNQAIGEYAGALAGTNASEVAGVLVFKPLNTTLQEFGVFMVPSCRSGNASASCP